MTDETATLKVILDALGLPLMLASVASIEEAARVFRAWIEKYELQIHDLTPDAGKIIDGAHCVARLAFSGYVWPAAIRHEGKESQ